MSTRSIPGAMGIPDNEVLYVECSSWSAFRKVFPRILVPSAVSGVIPKNGGMLNENACIQIPDGTYFFAVSWQGDCPAWRTVVREFCQIQELRWAVISEKTFEVDGSRSIPLSVCTVSFFKK